MFYGTHCSGIEPLLYGSTGLSPAEMLFHRKIKASSNLVQKESEIIKNHIRMTSILAHTFFYLLFVLIGILLDFLFIANLAELIDTGKYLKEYLGVVFCEKFTIMIRENEFGTHHGYNFKM